MPSAAGRHRNQASGVSSRPALLTLIATLCVLLGSGMAAVSLTSDEHAAASFPAGHAAIGVAPLDETPASGTAALGAAPSPTPEAPDPRSEQPTSRGERPDSEQPAGEQSEDQSSRRGGGSQAGGAGDQDVASLEEQVRTLTNAERAAAGCGALRMDDRLRVAARGHSEDMAARNYFSHTSPEGDSPSDRARAAGWPGGAGENIAMGYRSPEAVMDGWMNSDGHRRNLLNCSYTDIGVGVAADERGRLYWTQKFGRS